MFEGVVPFARLFLWIVLAVFVLLIYGRELRPIVQLLVDFIVKVVKA